MLSKVNGIGATNGTVQGGAPAVKRAATVTSPVTIAALPRLQGQLPGGLSLSFLQQCVQRKATEKMRGRLITFVTAILNSPVLSPAERLQVEGWLPSFDLAWMCQLDSPEVRLKASLTLCCLYYKVLHPVIPGKEPLMAEFKAILAYVLPPGESTTGFRGKFLRYLQEIELLSAMENTIGSLFQAKGEAIDRKAEAILQKIASTGADLRQQLQQLQAKRLQQMMAAADGLDPLIDKIQRLFSLLDQLQSK